MSFFCQAEHMHLLGYTADGTPVFTYSAGGEPVMYKGKAMCWVNSPTYFAELVEKNPANGAIFVKAAMPHYGDGPNYTWLRATKDEVCSASDVKVVLDKDHQPIEASTEADPEPAEEQLTLQLPL